MTNYLLRWQKIEWDRVKGELAVLNCETFSFITLNLITLLYTPLMLFTVWALSQKFFLQIRKFKGHDTSGHGSLNFSSAAKTQNYESTTLFLLLNRIQEQLSALMDFKVTFIAVVVWMHLSTLFGLLFLSPAFCLLGSVPPVLRPGVCHVRFHSRL